MLAAESPTASGGGRRRPRVHCSRSVDAVTATLQACSECTTIVEAAGCAIRAGLTAGPLCALASIGRLLLIALAVLRIGEQAIVVHRTAVRTRRGPRRRCGRPSTCAVAAGSILVQGWRRSRHHVAAGSRVIGVIDIVVVVVRDRVPVVGRAERRQYRQEPGKSGAPEDRRPVAAMPLTAAPASGVVATAGVRVASASTPVAGSDRAAHRSRGM